MIIDNLFDDNKKRNVSEGEVYDLEKEYGYEKPKSQPYRNTTTPTRGVDPDDEAYFREIFRKKREAAKKAEQGGQEGVSESEQLDELNWKDIQRGAKKIGKGAQKFSKNVAQTGDAVAGAANAIGGAGKELAKQTIARPVSAAYNAAKSGLGKATDVAATVGTDLGNAAKSVGRGVANVAGGTAGALGATVGGATTGAGRAAAKGFNAGVQNVGGDAVERLQTNIMKQIDAKKTEIAGLEKELASVSAQAQMPTNSITDQGGAINPETGKAYTPADVDAWLDKDATYRELLPKIKADLAATPHGGYDLSQAADKMLAKTGMAPEPIPTATSAAGAPSSVNYGQGFNKAAAPKPAAPSFAKTGFSGYKAATPAPKMPGAPAVPKAPTVTTGGPTAAEKAALAKRIAAAQAQPVAETVKQVKRMMETVTTKADVQRIKDYLDQHLGSNLTENARKQRNALLSEVTQLAAVRRRKIARQLAQ